MTCVGAGLIGKGKEIVYVSTSVPVQYVKMLVSVMPSVE